MGASTSTRGYGPVMTEVRSPVARARAAVGWFLRDPATGRVVLYQRPNARLTLAGALTTTGKVLKATHVVADGDAADVWLDRARTVIVLWWAVDEVVRGTTPYRRVVGGVVAAVTVTRAVRAERARLWDAG